jgi:hypothetical protein
MEQQVLFFGAGASYGAGIVQALHWENVYTNGFSSIYIKNMMSWRLIESRREGRILFEAK